MPTTASSTFDADYEKAAQKSVPSDENSPPESRVATIVKEEPDKEEFLVALDPQEDPKNISLLHKWIVVLVVSTSALCSTCASSMVRRP